MATLHFAFRRISAAKDMVLKVRTIKSFSLEAQLHKSTPHGMFSVVFCTVGNGRAPSAVSYLCILCTKSFELCSDIFLVLYFLNKSLFCTPVCQTFITSCSKRDSAWTLIGRPHAKGWPHGMSFAHVMGTRNRWANGQY